MKCFGEVGGVALEGLHFCVIWITIGSSNFSYAGYAGWRPLCFTAVV